MHLIVGLGNPGAEHTRQRHNIGFMAVDAIADAYGAAPFQKKYKGELSEARIEGQKCLLLKPQTYMNKSGISIAAAASFYKIPPEQIILIYDELDLAFGKLRCKLAGGAGGHNGVRSADAHVGKNTWRIRLGIDHPGHKDRVTGYVLSNFTGDEQTRVNDWMHDLAKELLTIFSKTDMREGMEALMTNMARLKTNDYASACSAASPSSFW